jgi:hypothetical protein
MHPGWQSKATTDPNVITKSWSSFAPNANIGVHVGAANLLVIDLDMPKHAADGPPTLWRLPGVETGEDVLAVVAERAGQPVPYDTYTVRTASGGLHLYFRQPETVTLPNSEAKLGWKVDTRGGGGLVVAAGSRIGEGSYVLVNDVDPLPLPQWLATLLAPTPIPAPSAQPIALAIEGRQGKYLRAALEGEFVKVRRATGGSRNGQLFVSALALGQLVAGGHLSEAYVRSHLLSAAAGHVAEGAFTNGEAARTITSGIRKAASSPRRLAA